MRRAAWRRYLRLGFPRAGGGTRFVDAPARFHGETVGMTCVRATETGSVDATAAFPMVATAVRRSRGASFD